MQGLAALHSQPETLLASLEPYMSPVDLAQARADPREIAAVAEASGRRRKRAARRLYRAKTDLPNLQQSLHLAAEVKSQRIEDRLRQVGRPSPFHIIPHSFRQVRGTTPAVIAPTSMDVGPNSTGIGNRVVDFDQLCFAKIFMLSEAAASRTADFSPVQA